MQDYKREFIQFVIDRKVLRFGEFTLKSGRISPYFFNAGLFNSGNDLLQLGKFYAQTIMAEKIAFDIVFGPAYKGIPLATATAISLAADYSCNKYYCFNRKETKDHGEGGNIVGADLQGNVLLVDDVITAGTAIRDALRLIKEHHARLEYILVALNRQERGLSEKSAIQELENEYGCKVFSIINLNDLIEYLAENKNYQEFLPSMQEYRKSYGSI